MNKRFVLVVASIVLSLIVALLALVRMNREPVYEGHPLSHWLAALESRPTHFFGRGGMSGFFILSSGGSNDIESKATEAVRQIGVTGVPFLIGMLNARDSTLKLKFLELAQKQKMIKFDHTPAAQRVHHALRGLEILGPTAKPAVPALGRFLGQNVNSDFGAQAARLLSKMGRRIEPAQALGNIGTPAKQALPILLGALGGPDHEIHWGIATGITNFGADAVSVVIDHLTANIDSNLNTYTTLWILGSIGPDAKPALPALVNCISNPSLDQQTRLAAVNALGRIGFTEEDAGLEFLQSNALKTLVSTNLVNGSFDAETGEGVDGESDFHPPSAALLGWSVYESRTSIRDNPQSPEAGLCSS